MLQPRTYITSTSGIKNTVNAGGIFFQPKLTINQYNNIHEQEADAMADKVMQGSLSKPAFFSPSSVQRKCAKCEEEERNMQRKESNKDAIISPSLQTENYISSLSGGKALSDEERTFFESGMGYDFSTVRIHNDSKANESAKSINALAYTHGNNIVFGSDQYQPNSKEGKKLLAHELTHVLQQNAGAVQPKTIQRDVDDKHNLTSAVLSGNARLEKCFDAKSIVMMPDKGEHVTKLQQALVNVGIQLPEFGVDGKYGDETRKAVIEFQQKAGMSEREWDGIVGRKTIGLLDKSNRNGTIEKDTDEPGKDFAVNKPKTEDKSCEGQPTEKPCEQTDLDDIDKVAGESGKLIDKVLTEQLPPKKTDKADYPAIYSSLFKNNDTASIDKVRGNYDKINKFIGSMKTDRSLLVCATNCDGGCRSGSPAYQRFSKKLSKKIIHFCPGLAKHPQRVLIVLHESHHAAIDDSSDLAYGDTRLIDKIDFNTALKNAASFHLYASAVDDPKTVIGHAVKDDNKITNDADKKKVDLALAHMEQWFRLVTFDVSVDIKSASDARKKGRYERPSAEQDMQIWAHWFGLTRPPAPPTDADIVKLKAIEERTEDMEKTFKNVFNITETTGPSNWANSTGTSQIDLNKKTIQLEEKDLVIALLQELVNATPQISANIESLYVGAINDMRNTRNLAP
jgi:hypothetical protein